MRRLSAILLLLAGALAAQDLPAPDTDLRTMLRRHVIRRAAEVIEQAKAQREAAIRGAGFADYRASVRARLREVLGDMPFGPRGGELNVRDVSRHARDGYRIENVLYESLPGWDVNATLFLPDPAKFAPPWPAIVIPVGLYQASRILDFFVADEAPGQLRMNHILQRGTDFDRISYQRL